MVVDKVVRATSVYFRAQQRVEYSHSNLLKQQRARRASYKLLKTYSRHKTNNHYTYTLFTKEKKKKKTFEPTQTLHKIYRVESFRNSISNLYLLTSKTYEGC